MKKPDPRARLATCRGSGSFGPVVTTVRVTTIAGAAALFHSFPGKQRAGRSRLLVEGFSAMLNHRWAEEFAEILPVFREREDLRDLAQVLIGQPIPSKAVEGRDRADTFRAVLATLVSGELPLAQAFAETERRLPRQGSRYASDNRVFAHGWGERLVRTNLSLVYNQAVLEALRAAGEARCFVPHSSEESVDSPCSQVLAGREHEVETLYLRLLENYRQGNWSRLPKIPDHPHCTHVVRPVKDGKGDAGSPAGR